jgi:dolichol-phosphate mannosyltransferase
MGDRRFEIVFVDDGSTDGTVDAITDAGKSHPNVRLLSRTEARGLSSAVIDGILASSAPIIAVMDADLQHDEAILPGLIDAVEAGHDLAVGTRYAGDGGTGEWSLLRTKISHFATHLSKPLLPTQLSDPMSGYFVISRSTFLNALPKLSLLGFKILLDIVASSGAPLRIAEIPYHFRTRTAGSSKLDSAVVLDYILLLADKAIGHIVPVRLLLFGLVGTLGVGVHLLILNFGMHVLNFSFKDSQTAAVIVAILFNFTLNNQFTYRDRRLQGWAWFRGLISFAIICGAGALANVGIGTLLFTEHHRWWVAGVAGAVVGYLWNYLATSKLTWRR